MTTTSEATTGAADAIIGLSGTAARWGVSAARRGAWVVAPVTPLTRFALRPSPVPEQYWPEKLLTSMAARGRLDRTRGVATAVKTARALVPQVLNAVLDQVDLTEVVIKRVDLDKVAQHLDVDAVIARVDLLGLAQYIIEGVDLPEIIRGSTGSIASEGIRGVRIQSIDADEKVNRLVDRMLLRRNGRRTEVMSAMPRQREGSEVSEPSLNGAGET